MTRRSASRRTLTCVAAALIAASAIGVTAQQPAPSAPLSFNKDIAPIVWNRCATCHRPGEVGPFNLITYRDVRQRATLIVDVTGRRVMPPWKPRAARGTFLDDRSLDPAQIALIKRWVDEGAVEGAAGDLPPLPAALAGATESAAAAPRDEVWQLGKPDVIVRMDEPYELPAGGTDVFRTFVLPIDIPASRLVRAVEFHPGNRTVHHANLGVDRTQLSRRRDERDPGPGYAGGMNPDAFVPGQMLGWTPGQTPRPSPEGSAWRLDPGTDFIAQLHMQPTGKPERIQVAAALYFTTTPTNATPVEVRLGSRTLELEPGAAAQVFEDKYVMPVDAVVTAIQPHAHNLARTVEAHAILPDGTIRSLIDIADWDFRWQDVYRYARPVPLPKGSTISTRFTFDNSAANPRNPNSPPSRVVWGLKTSDEMCDLWIQAIPVRNADVATLFADSGRKMLAEDTASYAKIVARNPSDAQQREDLALMYLQSGRVDEASAQLREALRLNPASAIGHYNLGLALAMQRQSAAAAAEFERALAIDPGLAEAETNLGVMLLQLNRAADAAGHFKTAAQLRPDSADAHGNYARVLSILGNAQEAIAHYQRAVQLKPDLLPALTGLAWIRATSREASLRNPTEATTLAERAVALTGRRDSGALDTLGAAYAAAGQFDRAVTTVRAAIDLVNAAPNPEALKELQARLALYENKQAIGDR